MNLPVDGAGAIERVLVCIHQSDGAELEVLNDAGCIVAGLLRGSQEEWLRPSEFGMTSSTTMGWVAATERTSLSAAAAGGRSLLGRRISVSTKRWQAF